MNNKCKYNVLFKQDTSPDIVTNFNNFSEPALFEFTFRTLRSDPQKSKSCSSFLLRHGSLYIFFSTSAVGEYLSSYIL